jgi:hypothetical protein
MADAVYQALDRMVPALEDFVVRGIFTQVRGLMRACGPPMDGMGWDGGGKSGGHAIANHISQCLLWRYLRVCRPPSEMMDGPDSRQTGRSDSFIIHPIHASPNPTQEEVRTIAAKRRDFEFLLRRRTARKVG